MSKEVFGIPKKKIQNLIPKTFFLTTFDWVYVYFIDSNIAFH